MPVRLALLFVLSCGRLAAAAETQLAAIDLAIAVEPAKTDAANPVEPKPTGSAPTVKMATDAAVKAVPPVPHAFTIHEEDIGAVPLAIAAGKLALKTEPAREIPLDELAKVDFANAPKLVARWLGQDNHDLAQAKNIEGTSGIQDLHVQLTGLVRNRPIKQIVLSQGLYLWKSDTTGASNWKLVVERTEGSGVADLYAEPPKGDRNVSDFKITVIYEDGAKVSAEVKAATPTDNTLKVVANAGQPVVPAPDGPLAVLVHLTDGGELSGQLEDLSKETLRLKVGADSAVEIPLSRLRGVWFESAGDAKAKKQFQERLKSPGAEDSAFVRSSADQSVTEIAGQVEEVREGKLRFGFEGQMKSINLARLVAVAFATHPPEPPTDQPYQLFQLANGDRVSGTWTGLENDVITCTLPWGATLSLPIAAVSAVEFRNGKLVYISDVEPAVTSEVSYFGRPMAYARDKSLLGEPLKLNEKDYRKGLAVHARTVLTYSIQRKYARFKSIVAFDESVPKRGRVVCRVLGDDRELFAASDLRADSEPRSLDLDVTGVDQLTLEIDFGEDEDICDRVIWASARLYRE